MNCPLFSVILPVYNAQESIARCIESIEKQTCSDYELIVIDDGSSDLTGKKLKRLSERYFNIVVLRQKNAGVSCARNLGIENAKGKYIAFIDSDDRYHPEYLSKMQHVMEQSAEMAIAGFRLCRGGKPIYSVSYLVEGSSIISIDEYVQKMLRYHDEAYWGANWNKVYLNQIIQKNNIKFQDKVSIGEDLYFNILYLQYAGTIGVMNEALYDYEITTTDSLSKQKRKAIDYCKQYASISDEYKVLCEKNNLCSLEIQKLRNRFIAKAVFDTLAVEIFPGGSSENSVRVLNEQIRKLFRFKEINIKDWKTETVSGWIAYKVARRNDLFVYMCMKCIRCKRLIMKRIRQNG